MFGLKTRRSNLIATYLVGAFILTLILCVALWYAFGHYWTVVAWLTAWMIAINFAAFCYYGYDKRRARIGSDRVPEAVLHSLTIVGGSIGAYVGMRFFRHKTIKGSFRILFWVLAAFQMILFALIIKYLS